MSQINSIAMLSVHTCPVAALGGKKTGGMNVYVRDLARQLGQSKIKVDIFTRCQSVDQVEVANLGPLSRVIHIPSGPAKDLNPINIFNHLHQFTQGVFSYQKKTKSNYQLIHSHYWLSGLVALNLQKKWHIPILQTFHTLGKVKNLFLPHHREPLKRLQAETQLVKKVDHILGFIPEEKQNLTKLYSANPKKITLIPPGVNTQRFKPFSSALAKKKIGLKPNQRLLLFVGRLDPIKGIETLLQALSILYQNPNFSTKNLNLAIIGGEHEDKYFQQIKQLSHKLNINNLTSFLGSRNQRVLPNYYNAAQVTIIPSSHESFGLVALESMACATPVIASQVGGLAHLVSHQRTGLLVPPNQAQPLATAINQILNQKGLRQKLSQNSLTHSKQFAWKKITPQIINLYQKII